MAAPSPGLGATLTRRPAPQRPLLPAPTVRLLALLALTAFGAGHWMTMVEPTAGWRAVGATVLVGAVALALLASRNPTRRRWRRAAVAATVLGGFAAALAIAGVPVRQLWPEAWDEAAGQIGSGLAGLAGARIPYNGIDEGLRLVIPLGGTLLALGAALLAFWPRRSGRLGFRLPALIVVVALYGVPATIVVSDAELVRGAVLTLLVLAYWRGERLLAVQARAAGVLAVAAVGVALAVAPAMDGDGPWWDYEAWVQDNAAGRTQAFRWDHDYSALLWPRDGREMLRVRAQQRTYWKVETLDGFDGRTWAVDPRFAPGDDLEGVDAANLERWTQRLEVNVRSLRAEQLPLAGTTRTVSFPGREVFELRPGVWTAGRTLRRGDAYEATVYTPNPDRRELAAATGVYPSDLRGSTAFEVITQAGGNELIEIPGFAASPLAYTSGGPEDGAAVLAASTIARTYRLSQRLLAGSGSPFAYVRNVQRHLNRGEFTYDETPPRAARTLDGFLFDAQAGFCQQYSGAMALLLRMGGVPARVVTGFSPGAPSRRTGQFIARDLDAHSWVEAYFPSIGWVTFDPTPSDAPPRAQAQPNAAIATTGDVRDLGTTLASDAAAAEAAVAEETGPRVPWTTIAAGTAGMLALLLAGRWAWRRSRRPRRPAVHELDAALRGVGLAAAPQTTLGALETRLASIPDVLPYVRALQAARYGGGAGPTAAQRRRLRRGLTRGRSPLVRWRAWRALPPRVPRRRA